MKLRVFLLVAVCSIVTGCVAVKPMAFDRGTKALDTSDKSIVLMTLGLSREDGSRYIPEPSSMFLESPTAAHGDERVVFQFRDRVDAVKDKGQTIYLARLALVGGEYKLQSVSGIAGGFPVDASIMIPLAMHVKVRPNSVTYLGRVTARMRPRERGEFRAGPILPLIAQAAAGIPKNTWDITMEDKSGSDVALFRARYPALKDVHIDIGPIPTFDRGAAERLARSIAPNTAME